MTGATAAPGLLARIAPPGRVAVVRPSRLGDFICATPALRALRAALPAARITVVTLPCLQPLVERLPYVDAFAPFPGFPGIAEQLFDARRATAFLAAMQEQQLDLAVQMHESGVNSNPFTLLLGAVTTAGFVRHEDRPGLLDAALPIPRTGHEVDRVLSLPTFLGGRPVGRTTDFPLLATDRSAATALLAGLRRPLIAVHAGGREQSRRWPVGCWAAAIDMLRASLDGSILLLGDEGEAALNRKLNGRGPGLDLSGRCTLGVLGAVVERCDLFLGNSSGPAHVAYALGTPTVTVLSTADEERYGPPAGPHATIRIDSADALPALVAAAVRLVTDGRERRSR